MSMNIPFTRGQVFVSADPRDKGRRIQVVSGGRHRPGEVLVGTIGESGKLLRQRWMNTGQFHDSKWTRSETVRVTGYVLESAL